MARIDELLDRAVERKLTVEEAGELRRLLGREGQLKKLDERIKLLIAFGVGAAAGYALPRLLEENAPPAPPPPPGPKGEVQRAKK